MGWQTGVSDTLHFTKTNYFILRVPAVSKGPGIEPLIPYNLRGIHQQYLKYPLGETSNIQEVATVTDFYGLRLIGTVSYHKKVNLECLILLIILIAEIE